MTWIISSLAVDADVIPHTFDTETVVIPTMCTMYDVLITQGKICLHLPVNHQLPDWQGSTGEVRGHHIQPLDHQNLSPPRLCPVPTYLFPLHKRLLGDLSVKLLKFEGRQWHHCHRSNQERWPACLQTGGGAAAPPVQSELHGEPLQFPKDSVRRMAQQG